VTGACEKNDHVPAWMITSIDFWSSVIVPSTA
jgi:hypothetical protein